MHRAFSDELDGTLPYASMRMLDGAGRLRRAAEELHPRNAFFMAMLAAIEDAKVKVMHDVEGYATALDGLQEQFVREAKLRNAAVADTGGGT